MKQHLDVANIIKKQILVEILIKMRMNKLERYFLRRNHRFVIKDESKQLV